jgi:hypothetical protein
LLGQDQLLLRSLNDGGGVDVVGLFEFLAGDVGELCVGDQGRRFSADQFLFQDDELGRLGLFVLELLDFILNLPRISS